MIPSIDADYPGQVTIPTQQCLSAPSWRSSKGKPMSTWWWFKKKQHEYYFETIVSTFSCICRPFEARARGGTVNSNVKFMLATDRTELINLLHNISRNDWCITKVTHPLIWSGTDCRSRWFWKLLMIHEEREALKVICCLAIRWHLCYHCERVTAVCFSWHKWFFFFPGRLKTSNMLVLAAIYLSVVAAGDKVPPINVT